FGLYPTWSDLAGVPAPDRTTVVDFEGACEEMDAIGFANVLCDPDAIGPEVVFSEHGLRSDLASYLVRSKQFKYVHHVGGSCHELYDLENDAGEFHNLIGEAKYQSVVKDLLAQLFAWYDPDENVYGRQ
ncbi:MAG: sulfatase/phosphatase domain-containing protein, partial [Candidatus Latescibacterota bacterium]